MIYSTAKQSAERAQNLVPESAYAADETRPWMVLLEVNKAINARGGVVQAGNFESQNALATDQNAGGAYPVTQGIYDPATDASRNVAAAVPAANAGSADAPRMRACLRTPPVSSYTKRPARAWKAMIVIRPSSCFVMPGSTNGNLIPKHANSCRTS